MSADASGHAYRHAPFKGSTFVVLLAIADTVSDQHDNEFFMRLTELAKKCRIDRDTARRSVVALVDAGWLEVLYRSEGKHPSRYRFVFDDARPVVFEGRFRTPSRSAGSESNPRISRGVPADLAGATPSRSAGLNNQQRTQSERVPTAADARAAERQAGTACPTCLGSRWVLLDDDIVPTSTPCPTCRVVSDPAGH